MIYGEKFLKEEYMILNEAKDPTRKAIVKRSQSAIKSLLLENGFPRAQVGGMYMGGECAKFMKGEGNTYLYALNFSRSEQRTGVYADPSSSYGVGVGFGTATVDLTDKLVKWIGSNKPKIVKTINDELKSDFSVKVESVSIRGGKMGVINLVVKYNFK